MNLEGVQSVQLSADRFKELCLLEDGLGKNIELLSHIKFLYVINVMLKHYYMVSAIDISKGNLPSLQVTLKEFGIDYEYIVSNVPAKDQQVGKIIQNVTVDDDNSFYQSFHYLHTHIPSKDEIPTGAQ